jgi:hypothetical protein
MAKMIRTRPSKTSRATLRELAAKGVLTSSMVGLRNIIRADTGKVEEQGFDLWELNRTQEQPANFFGGLAQCHAWIGYSGGRAHLTATTGSNYWGCTIPHFSTKFAVNQLAGQLIQQSDVRGAVSIPDDGMLYGDAVLVTDVRRHWTLYCRKAEADEIEFFNEMLSTPRTLIEGLGRRPPQIFFHIEPTEDDLVFMKLRFG